jgi:hypothetical protein
MNQTPTQSLTGPKRFGVRSLVIVILLIAAAGTCALILRPRAELQPRAELTFTETVLPGCVETHYAVTQDQLRVTRNGKTIARVPASPGLLAAIRNPVIGALADRYDELGTDDGIHVDFRFASGRTNKEIRVKNRYVPSLSRILDECNRSLPTAAQSRLNLAFVWQRKSLEELAARMKADTSLPAHARVQILEELYKAASELPEPSNTPAGTEPSPPKSRE